MTIRSREENLLGEDINEELKAAYEELKAAEAADAEAEAEEKAAEAELRVAEAELNDAEERLDDAEEAFRIAHEELRICMGNEFKNTINVDYPVDYHAYHEDKITNADYTLHGM